MTPELKKACEVVFQEHKTAIKPIIWNKDAFHGRLPFGLSAMAKEILIKKNIICFPNPEKKTITSVNPVAVTANNFEEAENLVQNKVPVFVESIAEQKPEPVVPVIIEEKPREKQPNYRLVRVTTGQPVAVAHETKWYMKPVYYYFVWPACAAVGGAVITWTISFLYTLLFF